MLLAVAVGVVREVTWDGDVKDMKVAVDFPENHSWEGFYQELECIPGHGFKVFHSAYYLVCYIAAVLF